MEPITEQRQVPGLLVYGYLRLASSSPARRAALSRTLAGYCEQHELILAAVFADIGTDRLPVPGFAGLLDAIATGANYGIVIPTLAHLGARPTARDRLAAITRTGRRLMIVHITPARAMAGRSR